MAESLDFTPVLREIEAKRLASEEKTSRENAIQFQQNQQRLMEIGKELKNSGANQRRQLENERQNILDSRREARENKTQISDQVQALRDQKDAQEELAKRIEANGGKADQNLDFLKRNNAIQREELKLAQSQATSASQRKEIEKDLRKAQIEGLKLALDPVIAPITSFASIGKRILGTSFGVPGLTLGRLALLAALPLIIKFLRSDMFDDILDSLKDLDLSKIGDSIKNSVMGLGGALAAIGLTIARATAMLGGAAGVRGAGSLVRDTKLTAKGLVGKDEIITSKSGQRFKLDAGGALREIDKSGTFKGGPVRNQQDLLKELAKEGSLGERGKLLGSDVKGNRFLRSVTGVLKRIPFLSQIFAINDLVNVLAGPGDKAEKAKGLAEILGGLGGGTLGAILGGIVGSFVPVIGNLIGATGGGILGYFAGKMTVGKLADGIAQYAVGLPVTAFDGDIFGVSINRLLSGSGLGVSDRGTSAGMVGGVSGGKEVVDKLATTGVVEDASITGDAFTTMRTFSARPFSALTGAPQAEGIFGKFIEGIDDNIIFPRRNVNIEADNVNMSGTMLDKFANLFAEFIEFGGRNVVVNNTAIQGGDQTMQGGRSQVNVLTHADPMHRAILSSVAN